MPARYDANADKFQALAAKVDAYQHRDGLADMPAMEFLSQYYVVRGGIAAIDFGAAGGAKVKLLS